MKKSEAIKIILSKSNNRLLLERLTAWDENKTFVDNRIALKISSHYARQYVVRYGLEFVKIGSNIIRYNRKARKEHIKNWNPKLTLRENAKKLRIDYNKAVVLSNNHRLPYTKSYKNGLRLIVEQNSSNPLREQCKELASKGFTNVSIGKVYGLSRERISQILL